MAINEALELGRRSFADQAWGAASAHLSAADEAEPLALDDLERLATAAYMAGEHVRCANAWTRAHQAAIKADDLRRAARCAFWQACGLFFRNELAPGMGWVTRGRRVLEEFSKECPEKAWLLSLTAFPLIVEGRGEEAIAHLKEAFELAERSGDAEVRAYVRLEYGPALVEHGQTAEGLALLDELMVAVTAGEVSPTISGIAYCQVVGTCRAIFDWRRAREWTEAFMRWCESQSGLATYQGNCLLDRCQVLQLQGAWREALEAAQEACEVLVTNDPDMVGSAHYQVGEIQRLRGNLDQAEESYRRASLAGRDPEPGMSLLRLAQGRGEAAAAAIMRARDEAQDPLTRCKILPAFVEIMLATSDIDAARVAAEELASIANEQRAPFLQALAAHTCGEVLLAQGDHKGALNALRDAQKRWNTVEAPYEAARVRILMAQTLEALGDADGAALEREGGRWALEQLGAAPGLHQLRGATPAAPNGLTAREREVLSHLVAGKTNRQISDELVISEHTVARHVQNIFAKIGVSSRSAAISYAFEHNLV